MEFALRDTYTRRQKKKKECDAQPETPKSPVTNIRHVGPLIPGRAISLHLSLMELAIALSLAICIPDD